MAILSSDLFKEALATLPTLLLIKKSYLEPLILSLKNSNLSSYMLRADLQARRKREGLNQ